jgi:hypothetical protein
MKKFTFKKDRKELTDQEINQQMNFDKFISAHTPPVKGWFTSGIKLNTLIASFTVVAVIAGYILLKTDKKEDISSARFIDPPIQLMNIPVHNYIVNSDSDSTLIHTTGSIIKIPSGAFVDVNGKEIRGNVEIHYREFHNPVDILLSGIPMSYDSAGTIYQLKSAGMFEITATQNGKAVHLKPEKILLVNMISHTNDSSNYNIYNLDTVQRKWIYISENTTGNKTCNSAFAAKTNNYKSIDKIQIVPDLEKPIMPKKADPGANNFLIDFNKDEFPELAVYKDLKFEPIDKKYDASLSKRIWEEVLIERNKDNQNYTVTFSAGKETHSFTVIPVVDAEDYPTAMADLSLKQKQYEKLLAEKKRNNIRQNDSLYEINSIFKGAAAKSNLNERFNNFIQDNYPEGSEDLLVYRTFSVSKLGIWNSDQPFPFFSTNFKSLSGDYAATFVDEEGKSLLLRNLYLVRRSANTIVSVPNNHFHYDHFPFYPESIDVMVGITVENELVYLKDEQLKNPGIKGKTILLKMNKTDKNIVSSRQLKNLLKI